MSAELYALATALLRGFATVPSRRGLLHSNPNTSVLFYLIINAIFLWPMTFILYPVNQLDISGIEYFVLAGTFAPGIARIFRDIGFNRLGVTITSPVIGTNTLFVVLLALLFLGEEITFQLIIGAMLTFSGVTIITWRRGSKVEWRKKDLIFPVIAALLFAFSTNLRKIGLLRNGFPLLGAAITSTTSLAVLSISILYAYVRKRRGWIPNLNRDAVKFFTISGIASSMAFLLYFTALSASYVSKVQPIAATDPLFAVLFSYVFLKDIEKITLRIVLGAILIVMGIVLILM